ncbi:MAG: ferrous iron transport protein B [bacterium]|nr:ferrous iron transport protein B [bacterium]
MEVEKAKSRILMVGNPNAGKTLLFNRLTGLNARVANFPGMTVDFRQGHFKADLGELVFAVDLPGTYSLIPRSEDEEVTTKAIFGGLALQEVEKELIVAVVDATMLQRNLYLVAQLLELKRPLIVVLTMMDLVEKENAKIDIKLLSERMGVKVIPVSAMNGDGLDQLIKTIEKVFAQNDFIENSKVIPQPATNPSIIKARYERVDCWLQNVVVKSTQISGARRLKIDDILLHRFWGLFFLFAIFATMLEILFLSSTPIIEAMGDGIYNLSNFLRPLFPSESLFGSLIVDGVIAGVGSVLIFVPLIAILFFFIGILEDSGYLARATFLLDRIMNKVGLSGRSFVPLLSGFACAVPAIMATRVIESKKDRFVTILVAPLMSCSARLPVYGLLIAAVFAASPPFWGFIEVGAVVLIFMYLLGIVFALLVAAVLKRTLFKSPVPVLILELPQYRMPRWTSILHNVWGRVQVFLREAGTVILAMTVVLWGLFTFPRYEPPNSLNVNSAISLHQDELAMLQLKHSYAGRIGHFIEPIVKPLGFDWKIGVGILSSFAAREVFVSTLGVVYGLGHDQNEQSNTLKQAIRNDINSETGKPLYTPLVALSLMVFFALAMQCMSTLAVTRRETKSLKWPLLQFSYMTVLAWVSSFTLFQVGTLLGF